MRVVWAVSFLQERWTDLQYKMLLASVKSWKQHNPKTTTVLYGSLGLLEFLEKAKCLSLWDEVHEDLNSYLSGNYREFTWDYPKVEALFREKQKVLYIDYDIIFHKPIILDKTKQYCLHDEPIDKECYYSSKQKMPILPSLEKLVIRSNIAYNTGILYLNYETVVKWRNLYSQIVPYITAVPEPGKFCLTIGQGCLPSIAGSIDFLGKKYFDCYTHFLGGDKHNPTSVAYLEYEKIIDRLYPSSTEFVKLLKQRKLV